MKQKNIKGLISEYFIFLIFIALVVVLTCLKPSFIAPTNLVNILKQASINGILAFGMMFVIIAGGFDMSDGSIRCIHRHSGRSCSGKATCRSSCRSLLRCWPVWLSAW